MRYDFPGILAMQFFWLVCLYIISGFILDVTMFSKKTKIILVNFLKTVFFSFLLLFTSSTGYMDMVNTSSSNSRFSSEFTNNLTKLSGIVSTHASYPLILKTEYVWDYESIFSMERFLKYMGVNNPIYLDYKDDEYDRRGGIEQKLSDNLTQISNNGLT